ncbi:iron complex transport system ATP-binding protein (plasmid) [Ketogulonicigenium robustum]|uniref:Iron complex transport system ATP-binding protein n=1 Tax=Ketogulonicigenium robustum TaxID=92947 RepID=A0A1W6P3C4_9RHOB|nr:ABC transporter ATP-binding protein [Ketogulonicigenium robustum]ARO16005.1 iron complex transport system ATP-binding protein [Ketogulonicigenium robustum]
MSRLSVENLSAGYGARPIVTDVSLGFPTGGITALIGPNGCGKSTLLKTLGRILAPTQGAVILDGKSIHALPTRQLATKLGLLPQGPTAPEGLTVRDLVAQGRFPHQGMLRQWSQGDEAAITAAMAQANVTDLAQRAIDTLSGGQRQRAWIAMVLAQDTDLILLDEPTTFLDLRVQIDLMDLLAHLAHDRGRTLIVVLHELNLAAAYADHLVMMKDGRILHHGPVAQTFTAATLHETFGLDAQIIPDPETGTPLCVPRSARPK